jgi:hypothetical protein
MRALDIETKTYHQIRQIDFVEGIGVLWSERYGRTRQTMDNVKLVLEKSDPKLTVEKAKLSKRDYKLRRIESAGYKVHFLGRNIQASKNESILRGSVGQVHKILFHY